MTSAAMCAFREAALRRGAYAEQVATGTVAFEDALARESPTAELLELKGEFSRLLCNISCRLGQRDPALLRPQRDALSSLNSKLKVALKACGVVDVANAAQACSNSGPAACELLQWQGPRHLCENGCYLRAFESMRILQAEQDRLASSNASPKRAVTPNKKRPRRSLDGAAADEGSSIDSSPHAAAPSPPDPTRAVDATPLAAAAHAKKARVVTSRFFARAEGCLPSSTAVSPARTDGDGQSPKGDVASSSTTTATPVRRTRAAVADAATVPGGPWRPPHSPFGLLEELFWDRPWALLLCCILLNQTTRGQVDGVLARLLRCYPDAASLAVADPTTVEDTLRPLGLHRRRARTIIAFSSEFLKGAWRRPEELPGIGQYAADAHRIFCEGRWAEVEPQDHALRWYVGWLRSLA